MALGHFEGEAAIARYFSGLSFQAPRLVFRDYSPPNDRCPRGYFQPKNHRYCRSCPGGTIWSPEGCVAMVWSGL